MNILKSQIMRKYNFLMETGIALLVLWIINLVFFIDNPGFIRISPHPYLLIVVYIAVRYGYTKAIISIIITGFVYMICVLIHINRFEEHISRIFQASYLLPLSYFFIAATIIGMITDTHKKKNREAQEQIKVLKKSIEEINKDLHIKHKLNEKLTQDMEKENILLTQLYLCAKKINTLQRKEFYRALVELIENIIEAQKIAVFKVKGDKLILEESHGYRIKEKPKIGNDMIKQIVLHKKVISLKDQFSNKDVNANKIFMGGPLCLGSGGETVAVIYASGMPFLKYSTKTLKFFSIICDWASIALKNIVLCEVLVSEVTEHKVNTQYTEFRQKVESNYQGIYEYGKDLSDIFNDFTSKVIKKQ